jgi:uncharacterized membrane protein YphA (DoxX/SURF4 family)
MLPSRREVSKTPNPSSAVSRLTDFRREREHMGRKIAYWVTTIFVSLLSGFAAFSYLSGDPRAVQGFAHVGYPDQLRILLGIAKPLGAIALLIPGWPRLKEWAYAGFTFAWIAAHIAHHLAHDPAFEQVAPLVLLAALFVSYFTRPDSRKLPATVTVTSA